MGCRGRGEEADPEPIELLVVSGDEAASNPDVRALAERASKVLAISMFRSPLAGWADLVLPGTSYLERDGTYMNLEGRLQRLRRAVIPPCPDELAWIAKLAERFGVEVSPHAPLVFAEISERCYGGLDYTGSASERRCRARAAERRRCRRLRRPPKREAKATASASSPTGRSSRARPSIASPSSSSSGPARRSSSRPTTRARLGLEPGGTVTVRSNGTSVELRARVNKSLAAGVARVAAEHAQGLGTHVEVGA